MASAIDPTKPVDGVAAEKADLRANLLAAKNEIEALQSALASQGAVVYPEDFGAVPNRTTECAAAINSAIQAASTFTVAGQLRGGRVQLSKGDYRISSTIQLRSLCDLVGISQTATTLWVPSGANIRAVQTFNTDQIIYGIRQLGIYGNAANQTADNGSGTLTGAAGSDTGGVYLLNAKAEPSAIGEYQFLGGCRSWAQDLLIQEVGGNGFVAQGNSGWIVDHIHVRWARRYGIYLDTNDGSFEQMIASRTGWAGMFVDGASNRISNVKVWFNGVEMDKWLLAKTWTSTNDTTANARQFSSNQKAGVGVLVRGDRNRIWLTDVQDTAGHGAYIHGRFNWCSLTLDQVGQVNAGGSTTRYDGGGAGANDWVDLNPGQPLVGVFVQQNQRGVLDAFVHDLNYNNDGTPGGSVLHHALQHMVLNQEIDLTLRVYGHQEIMAQRVPPTAPVVSASPYTLNGVSVQTSDPRLDLQVTFGAAGDGVTDDGPELSLAIIEAMSTGRTLYVPEGVYLATTWTAPSIVGPLRIRMEPGAVIRIPGTTQFLASGPSTFYDFDIEGGEIDMDLGGRIAEWRGHSAGSSVLPLFRLVDVTIRNVINTGTPAESSAKCFDCWDSTFDRILIDRIEFTRVKFIGGTISVELAGVRDGAVTDCRFLNQTYLGCAINRATTGLTSLHESRSGRVSFKGNVFRDTINGSTSADTHGLMLFGSGYSVMGNHFGLCRSGNANGNCEGYYSKGQDIQIVGNTFEDAGGQRGFISLKGTDFLDATPAQQHPEGYSIVVSSNTFRCTASFVTSGPPNPVAIHFEAVNVLVSDNSFYNFGTYRTMTRDTEQFDLGGVVMINNNLFFDCGAGNDTIVLDLGFLGSLVRLFVHDNQFVYQERIGGRIIYLENATCHASIKGNFIRGHASTPATKGIWIRSTGASMIASADVSGNRFLNCTAGFELSGGSGAVPLLIHANNRRVDTGAVQETITSTVTTNIDEGAGTGGSVNVDQYDVLMRLASGNGAASGFTALDLTEKASPSSGDWIMGWETGGAIRRYNVANLPTGTGITSTTVFGAGRTGENNRSLAIRIQDVINVLDFGAVADGSTNDRTSINEAIAHANTTAGNTAEATDVALVFPPGKYGVAGGALTAAHGNYSIIMMPGAQFVYNPSGFLNTVMWTIGSTTAFGQSTIDGRGVLHFELAASSDGGGGNQYGNDNNVAFEFINMSHFSIYIRAASEFQTGLRMTADAEVDGNKHMYDVDVRLGYLHSCMRNLVQRTRFNGWQNNIRYWNGNFSAAAAGARYLNIITEGDHGDPPGGLRGGENKAVFYEPLCDGHSFTALYVRSGTAAVYGGHMENPRNSGDFPAGGVIEHELESAGVAPGGEPCIWIAPRLEAKQHYVIDPHNVGSYCYDPFWGPGPTPRPLAITSNRDLATGDVRAGRMLFNNSTTNRQISIPDFGGGAQEPPVMSLVNFHQRDTGWIELLDDGTGIALMIPTGKIPRTRGVGSVMTAQLISLNGEDVPASYGANQVWSVFGDLADAP